MGSVPIYCPYFFLFIGAIVIEMKGQKAHEIAIASHDCAALASHPDREAASRRLQLFPLQAVVSVDLLPTLPRDLSQRLDDLAQFASVEAEQLLLKVAEIQVEADEPRQARLAGRLAARFDSDASGVSARGVFRSHSPARRSWSRIAGS